MISDDALIAVRFYSSVLGNMPVMLSSYEALWKNILPIFAVPGHVYILPTGTNIYVVTARMLPAIKGNVAIGTCFVRVVAGLPNHLLQTLPHRVPF